MKTVRYLWQRLQPVERVALFWCVGTGGLMGLLQVAHLCALLPHPLYDPAAMLLMRLRWLLMTVVTVGIGLWWPCRWTDVMRPTCQLLWLIEWYPDTYEFNSLLPNLDHVVAQAEQTLFGCQPSLLFSHALPQTLWSEAFNLGYGSYFFMMLFLCYAVFFFNPRRLREVTCVLMAAFFVCYVVFIFVPVAGPQYYFAAQGVDAAGAVFPSLGDYFYDRATVTQMVDYPAGGFFRDFVNWTHATGERPTAAFPSSHIGIATIVMILAWRHVRPLAWVMLPLYVFLCCATVYIKAHYLVDALAGLAVAPLVLWLAERIYVRVEDRSLLPDS